MDIERARVLKAEVDADLAALEPEFAKIERRRDTLLALSSSYGAFIAAEMAAADTTLPASIITITKPVAVPSKADTDALIAKADAAMDKIAASAPPENTSVRTLRILQKASPNYLTLREILAELLASGWTTTSQQPILIVRNTMNDLQTRFASIRMKKTPAGRNTYASITDGGG